MSLRTKYNPAQKGVLDQLKADGYEVFVSHYRRQVANSRDSLLTRDEMLTKGEINSLALPKGGLTRVFIKKNGVCVADGEAECSSQENFNKKIGLTIALGRALKELNV